MEAKRGQEKERRFLLLPVKRKKGANVARGDTQLAKASTLALISMLIIVITVIVQGFLAPPEDRGGFSTPLLTVNTGIFQAIGVISFGMHI